MRNPLITLLVLLSACQNREPAPAAAPASTPPLAAALPAPATEAPGTLPPMSADPQAANTACADCHPDEAASYASTGMGRSLAPVAGAPVIEDFTRAEVAHPTSGFSYRAVRDADGRMWQEERIIPRAAPNGLPGLERGPNEDVHADWVRRIEAKYVIGSGNHTRSYLGWVDGALVQLPLTWYSTRKIWDLSPGYDQVEQPRFGRVVEPACLFCHNGLTPQLPDTVAGYREPLAHGIGCDRCHGDGAQHVAARQAGQGPAAGQPDPSIFNPGRETADRQLQVCQQCHLQADASVVHAQQQWDRYDPRLPLNRYLSVFRLAGQAGSAFTIASHGRRLALSRCAKESAGKLACTSCHNPHTTATEATHRAACLSCHGEAAAGSTPIAKSHCPDPAAAMADASCHTCHMASGGTSDVPHVKFTDHLIRRRPGDDGRPEDDVKSATLVDLVSGSAPLDTLDGRLRVGMAHTFLWERSNKPEHLPEAVATLQAVLKDAPRGMAGLAAGYAALGRGLARQGKFAPALEALLKARDLNVDDPSFPDDLSACYTALNKLDEARAVLQAALTRHATPARWLRLGMLHLRGGHVPAARAALETAASLTTADPAPDTEVAAIALREGDKAAARTHLEAALALDFTHVPALLRMGLLELQSGRFAEALRPLDLLLARDPAAGPGWLMRAQARENLGQVDEALNDYARVMQLAPDRPEAFVAAASLALKHGRKEYATAVLTGAVVRFPKEPKILELLQSLEP